MALLSRFGFTEGRDLKLLPESYRPIGRGSPLSPLRAAGPSRKRVHTQAGGLPALHLLREQGSSELHDLTL